MKPGNATGEAFGSFFLVLLGGEPQPIPQTHHYLTGAVAGVAVGALLGYALDGLAALLVAAVRFELRRTKVRDRRAELRAGLTIAAAAGQEPRP